MKNELIELQAEMRKLKLIAKELVANIITIDTRIKSIIDSDCDDKRVSPIDELLGISKENQEEEFKATDATFLRIDAQKKNILYKTKPLPSDIVKYVFYSDGGARDNGKKTSVGGWACAFFDETGSNIYEASDATHRVTNNQMEIFAAIVALEALPKDRRCNVDAYLDSKYVIDGITSWVKGWVKNNWTSSKNKPVKNIDFWKRLHELNKQHNVNWIWVKGHNGNYGNEYVDNLINVKINNLMGNN